MLSTNMDTNRRKELTIARGVRVARKMSTSKTGSVILKDNVLEGNKLGSELDHIDQLQKKQATKMSWEQEYLFRKQRRSLVARVYSEPNLWKKTEQLAALHLPPISSNGMGHVEPDTQITEYSDRNSVANRMNKLNDVDESNSSRKLSEVGVKHQKALTRVRSTDSSSCLPALVSPRLLRRRNMKAANSLSSSHDGTKDPRFSKLIESLVPSPGAADKNLSDRERNERCNSSCGSPVPAGPSSPRASTPCPLSASPRFAGQRFTEVTPYSPIDEEE